MLNVHAPTEDKSDDTKDTFQIELKCVFDQFLKYHVIILLGDFNAKVGRADFFKQKIGNESLHGISNDNGVRVVNFATTKTLCHILIEKRWHSSTVDARSFREADCNNDHHLVTAKV
jgi:hypothetical protein